MTATARGEVGRVRNVPSLLPDARWARVALLLLMLFAFARSVLWASVQPGWFAPDEDYHWLYVNYLVEKGTFPNLDAPFYTAELYAAVYLERQGVYAAGPRTNYSGAPKAILHNPALNSSRAPAPPRSRPVLHPPAYYLPDVAIDNVLWHKDAYTRLDAMRYYSAALGALTIFFAWLLAAQVLAREWQQLAAAGIASLQPILAFSASTMTNDVGVAVTLTATLAWCAWMLRSPPRARQGIGLGLLFALAIMVKATNFSLAIIIGCTLLALWRLHPESRRELRGVLAWTVALPVVIAGWWYVRLVIVTGSILGERGSLTATHGVRGPGILHAPAIAARWLAHVYRDYWFDYQQFEVHAGSIWFWVPLAGIVLVAAGFALLLWRSRGSLLQAEGHELRVALLLAIAAIVLLLPPWGLDTLRGIRGLPFVTEQGRFLTPAFPGLAVIAVLALRELTARAHRWFGLVVGAFLLADFVFYWHTWVVWVLERFYGPIDGHWLRALFHASYDKPAFVTETSLAVLVGVAVVAFLAGVIVTLTGERRAGGSRPAGTEPLGRPQIASGSGVGW